MLTYYAKLILTYFNTEKRRERGYKHGATTYLAAQLRLSKMAQIKGVAPFHMHRQIFIQSYAPGIGFTDASREFSF